jgi:hypothetical protein
MEWEKKDKNIKYNQTLRVIKTGETKLLYTMTVYAHGRIYINKHQRIHQQDNTFSSIYMIP